MFKTIVTVALVGAASAYFTTGSCSQVELQANFDATRYTGAWFQVAKDAESPFENGVCEQARYAINPDGTLNVFNTQFDNASQTIETANGTAWCNGPQCSVSFFWFSPTADYRVVATDYENYALVYACNDLFMAKAEFTWLLTREQHPKQEHVDTMLQILTERTDFPKE